MRGVPVFAVPIGAETRLPDVELVAFDVPAFGDVGAVRVVLIRVPFMSVVAIRSSAMPRVLKFFTCCVLAGSSLGATSIS